MNFFATLHEKSTEKHLRYVVIGGLAINYYGYSRDTADLDLFISQNDRSQWEQLLASFGYTKFHDGGIFIQYEPPEKNAWPVDLMLVQEKTFAPIFQAGVDADFYGTAAKVPKLEHLIALKLHALKNTRTHRFLKDFLDVENLIRINKIDIKSQTTRELFEKYGTPDLYEKISRSLASA